MVRPLTSDDFIGFEPIDVQKEDFLLTKAAFDTAPQMPPHQACACDKDGNPVLLFGFIEAWPGVYESWTIFGKKWKPVMYGSAKQWLSNYLQLLDFDRVQHTISEDMPWMHRVIQYLGFQCETDVPLRKYRDGKDCYMYSVIKGAENGY